MEDVIASADIGATNITVTLCSEEGILIRLHQNVRLKGDRSSIPRQVMEMIDHGLQKTGMDRNILKAVGISSAGPFQRIDGMIELVSPNICGGMAPERRVLPNDWSSVPLEKELLTHHHDIRIENDAVSGAIAERTFGNGQGCNDLLYVTWSTGIGTGAYVDGRLIKGKNGNAPHGGHVYLGDVGPTCGCGNICDLESVASGTAIALEYGNGSTTAEVFKAYSEGDERAVKIIQRTARYLARGLASITCVLDTRLIVIGGSVFLNNKDILLPMVKDEFYRSFPAMTKDTEFAETGLGEYLGDIAAISLVIPEEWMEGWMLKEPWKNITDTVHLE